VRLHPDPLLASNLKMLSAGGDTMHATQLSGLSTTVQKTHEWLHQIGAAMGADDAHLAYEALRAVLHALRDRLTVDEAVQLGAQLPTLVRGLYYEGWQPARAPARTHKAEFLAAVQRRLPGPPRLHPEVLARAVLSVLAQRVSAGEIRDVKAMLPEDVRSLWPGEDGRAPAARPRRAAGGSGSS
jgi:uncharacterized protein (DUF2267 family)